MFFIKLNSELVPEFLSAEAVAARFPKSWALAEAERGRRTWREFGHWFSIGVDGAEIECTELMFVRNYALKIAAVDGSFVKRFVHLEKAQAEAKDWIRKDGYVSDDGISRLAGFSCSAGHGERAKTFRLQYHHLLG